MVGDVETVDASRTADSISVTIRFRPLSEREFQRGDEVAWYADEEVYEVAARPVVKSAMEGVNGDQDSPGIIPLAIKDVFSIIQDTPGREYLLRVSYLEIYNEIINDLLDPNWSEFAWYKEEVVLSPGHALSFIASAHRHVGSTNFNLLSSRSHTIFTLMIESSAHGDEYDGVVFSQLNLIDLAGSESSKTETTGLRRKEGSYINKSLLTLGTVSGHGYVSLICTGKVYEINASRNKLIDEKSLIRKELLTLKQQFEEGQVKMQSRLEEEEEAKAALMSRIQRLTKLILVSSKNTIPISLNEVVTDQQSIEDEGSLILGKRCSEDSPFTRPEVPPNISWSSSKGCEDLSLSSSSITESTQAIEVTNTSMPTISWDLFLEQAKMLAGEIALGESALKRLLEQSVNDPDSFNSQIQSVEREIEEKKAQMRVLEQHINKSGKASVANASISDMHQKVVRLMAQCSEKSFELEIKSADNRILQEELQNKISENKALKEKVNILQQQLASVDDESNGFEELNRKVQIQEYENESLKIRLVKLVEENTELRVQNQKVADEASYAKQLASAAAESLASNEQVHRSSNVQNDNGLNHKHSDPKARMEEVKDNNITTLGNTDANSHVCRQCFEAATATVLLPCRHLCLCKPCSMGCAECPICHTNIVDRIFIYPS
ncbi:unnamed protein product [Rhodiola kirilowii]